MLFDSHTHLNNETYTEEERLELVAEIENSQVGIVVDIGFDWESSLRTVKNTEEIEWCYGAVGVHPHDAKTMDFEMAVKLRTLAKSHKKIKAIGEIGLDYHYDLSPRNVQRKWFREQIRLALDLDLPMVIHSREADMETLKILKEEGAFSQERKAKFPKRPVPKEATVYYLEPDEEGKAPMKKTVDFTKADGDARVDIHCFSGSRELAIEYIKLGATIGVDGPITYKNNKKTVAVVEAIPLEFIMAETDAPYLTPVPFRGKPNKSPYVEYVIRKIAEIKGIEYEEAVKITGENGLRFFNIEE